LKNAWTTSRQVNFFWVANFNLKFGNAKKFIDFIISQEVQDTLGTTTTNRPVRKNAKTSENMKPIDKIKTLTEDYDYVIKNKSDIVKKYNEVFTDIQSKQ
ncbi:hypothetical protein OK964_09500, partial [Streptococcus pneumoniae]|nr:hypothetical protein [Streptococcus pneumoniae]MDG8413461.1 hypothetical protein [Streptococcus pneumoniae]MDG8987190.1 hypothetical protein [Streptococcus pneumoniae]